MQSSVWRYNGLAAAAVMMLLLGACKERGSGDSAAEAERRAAGETGTQAPAGASAAGALTDANIAALLDEANVADSAAGSYALTKATDPDVKAFAKLMMGEHHALRVQGQQLAKKLNLTPQPPANDPVKTAASAEMAALKAAPKGRQFDRTYIEQEVAIHKAVLDLAEQLPGAP
jgi:putative membrane protein